jgi:outer membrane protein TolC
LTFDVGPISFQRLLKLQTSLTEARSRFVDARFEAKRAEITLRRLSGRLLSGRQTADRDTQLAA